jgi:hypothetical protein
MGSQKMWKGISSGEKKRVYWLAEAMELAIWLRQKMFTWMYSVKAART